MTQASTILDQFGRPYSNQYFFYRAADRSTSARSWLPFNTSDARVTANTYTRQQLLSHARYLYANVGFVKGVIDDMARFSVGDGIAIQSQCEDDGARSEYEGYWREVFSVQPEITGNHPMDLFQKNISKAVDVDGDIGLLQTVHENGEPCFQVFEGHEIGGKTDPSKRIIDGVQINAFKRAVGYYVKGQNGEPKRVDAGSFMHVFDPHRFTASRGVTALAHAINNARDVLELLDYEKTAVKENSAIGLALKGMGQDGDVPFFGPGSTEDVGSSQTIQREQIRAGAIPRLNPGEEIQSWSHKRPGTTFTGFLDYLDADVATGTGLALAFVRAYRDGNGTAQRFILQKCQRRFNERTMLINRILKRAWFYVIGTKIYRRELPDSPGWWRVQCQPPSKITVDVGREAQQNRDDIKLGNRTLAEDAGERGVDWEELRAQRQRESVDAINRAKAMSEETGQPFNLCLSMLWNSEISMAADTVPTDAGAEPGEDGETVGETDAEAIQKLKVQMDAYGVGVRAGALTPTIDDENHFRDQAGLPKVTKEAQAAWNEDGGVRRPITLVVKGASGSPPPPGQNQDEETTDDEA